jgi:predicted ABC-type ATPase
VPVVCLLQEIDRRVRARDSFAFETTLSGHNYARLIPRWQAAGYHVKFIFLGLPSADLAVERVAARVAQGGHDVPEEVIRRRFAAGLRNLEGLYQRLVDSWVLYDNSGPIPQRITWRESR